MNAWSIGLCKQTPTGDLFDEDEFFEFEVPGELFGKSINIFTQPSYEGRSPLEVYFKPAGKMLEYGFPASMGTSSMTSGNLKIEKSGTNYFDIELTFMLSDGVKVVGLYSGLITEYDNATKIKPKYN